jgi:S1-C subfamily serine protease
MRAMVPEGAGGSLATVTGPEKAHFVGSTRAASDDVLRVGDATVWSICASVFGRIDALCGDDASTHFAEPTVRREQSGEALNIAWFGAYDDVAKPLDALDAGTRARVEGDLRTKLDALRPALADPEIGDAVGAMLNLADSRSVMGVGEHAVLVNWGILPRQAQESQDAFAAHSAATIGPYLPLSISPRIPGKSWRVDSAAASAGISPPRKRRTAPPAGGHVAADAAVATAGRSYARVVFWPALLLSAIFALALVYLYWPGHLIYPVAAERIDPAAELARRQEINRTLETRIAQLQEQLAKAPCDVDAAFLEPDLGPVGPPADGAATPGATGATPPASGAPAPGAAPAGSPTQAAPGGQSSLMERLDQATVLVLAPIPDGLSTGSGFFVTPTSILTNRHVVENAGDDVYIASHVLGRILPAHVAARTDSAQIGNSDFALLQIAQAPSAAITPLSFGADAAPLDGVIAAGFPSLVMQMDQTYRKVISGDASTIANLRLAVTSGSVMALPQAGSAQVITHSAIISPGSSGGPLIDRCGRVVGVNTFISFDNQSAEHLNFALGAADAERFLSAHSIAYRVESSPCAAVASDQRQPPPAGGQPQAQAPSTAGTGDGK